MEHNAQWTQRRSNDHDVPTLDESSVLYPPSTSELFAYPSSIGSYTTGVPISSYPHPSSTQFIAPPTNDAGVPITHSIESLAEQHYPIANQYHRNPEFHPTLHPQTLSGSLGLSAQLPHNPYPLLFPPVGSFVYPHYYQPPFSAPALKPFFYPQFQTNLPPHAAQPSNGAFTAPHQPFIGPIYPGQAIHQQYLGAQFSPPTMGIAPPQGSSWPSMYSQQSQRREAFSFQGNVLNNPVLNDVNINNPQNFMSELLKETIPGAAFDSSSRDPPPRCHPGTRLAIIDRVQHFIANRNCNKKMFWIVGPAGVGKSAIMQTVSESSATVLGASIFFSVSGRNDGTKTIATLAYQLATHDTPYRQFIQGEMMNDPSLLHKSMATQFNKFIVEPFIHRLQNCKHNHFLIVIDGLDECSGHNVQRNLLGLISFFCITYPTSPLVWVIASRPEPHVTSFFSRANVRPIYEKEEMTVNSHQDCQDVEHFLRHQLKRIQRESSTLKGLLQWPTEHKFLKIADASHGLFAFASTVVKFIDDPAYGNPASQLDEVLEVINSPSTWLVNGKSHPMTHIDALYTRILSGVPTDVMENTRKILLTIVDSSDYISRWSMVSVCNWLGMTKDTAYSATYHLRSVLLIPEPDAASREGFSCFHKSFVDYLIDPGRSGFCTDIKGEIRQLNLVSTLRILEEAPNGTLEDGPGTIKNISLSWRPDEPYLSMEFLYLYAHAARKVVTGLVNQLPEFQDSFYIGALTAFEDFEFDVPFDQMLFDECRRSELMEHNVLKQMPLGMLDSDNMSRFVDVRFKCPATIMAKIPDPRNLFCNYHEPRGDYEEGQDQNWVTGFSLRWFESPEDCDCVNRFFRHFESGKARCPDELVTVFINVHLFGWVEYRFIDPQDGVSEWTYRFDYHFPSHTGM